MLQILKISIYDGVTQKRDGRVTYHYVDEPDFTQILEDEQKFEQNKVTDKPNMAVLGTYCIKRYSSSFRLIFTSFCERHNQR